MDAVIAGFRAATYPPFPSLSSFVASCASAQAQGAAQGIAQDLVTSTRDLDASTQLRFYLELLWDVAAFIATRAQEYDAATFQGTEGRERGVRGRGER